LEGTAFLFSRATEANALNDAPISERHLWRANLKTKRLRQLTTGAVVDLQPTVSGDRTTACFTRVRIADIAAQIHGRSESVERQITIGGSLFATFASAAQIIRLASSAVRPG
jgi:hypothetical protein